MTENVKHISEFWRVFGEHSNELAEVSSADHPVYDLILEKLQQIDSRLYFEYSSEQDVSELIITAEGDHSLFPLVERIVASAPKVPGWLIIPLKPKIGFPVTARWENITVDIADAVFDPLYLKDSKDLGLRIYVRGLSPDHIEDAHNALLRAIDHGLGEREFAESVQFTEVLPLPSEASFDNYIALTELESYINWRKSRL